MNLPTITLFQSYNMATFFDHDIITTITDIKIQYLRYMRYTLHVPLPYIDGLAQYCNTHIANALELLSHRYEESYADHPQSDELLLLRSAWYC